MKFKRLFVAALFCAGIAGMMSSSADATAPEVKILVIVARNSNVTNISLENLKRLYRGQTDQVGSARVKACRSQEAWYNVFRTKVLGFNDEADEKQYWLREGLRGTVKAVKVVKKDADVIEFSGEGADRIGIISADNLVGNDVKVITVNGKGSSAADYPLTFR